MATTEFNDATLTADSTTAGTLKNEQHHRTTVRLLVGRERQLVWRRSCRGCDTPA